MLMIRLARHGSHKNPFYRIVAIDKRKKGVGAPSGVIGYWHPKKGTKKLDLERLQYWVGKGAHISKAVRQHLQKS